MKSKESTPATLPESAAAAANAPQRQVCAEVSALAEEFQILVERLLEDGSTFEEVVETVAERGGPHLTLNAVRDHFRSSSELQRKRVQHQVAAAASLKAALGNRKSAESQLAEAAFLTGFMRLSHGGPEPTLKDAESARLKRENLRLRQNVLRLKEQRERNERDLLRARAEHERQKAADLRKKVREVRREVKKNPRVQELAPEVLRKIDEIYGIVETPPPYTTGAVQTEREPVA